VALFGAGAALAAWAVRAAIAVPPPPPPEYGRLSVDTSPVKGEVFVDGVSWGTAPVERDVTPGVYTVSFGDVEGYETPAPQTVEVAAGETVAVVGVYEPVAPPPEAPAAQAVVTIVEGATFEELTIPGTYV